MATIEVTATLVSHCCSECGAVYGLGENFSRVRANDGKVWYCPNGHSQCRGEGYEKKLERQLAQERQAHDQTKAKIRDVEAELGRVTAKAKRLRTRAANGVCPCCKRTFAELAKHMRSKHPDYAGASDP